MLSNSVRTSQLLMFVSGLGFASSVGSLACHTSLAARPFVVCVFTCPFETATTLGHDLLRGIPYWFFGQVFFGGLVYQGQSTILFHNNCGFWALPPKAARPNNQDFLQTVWFLALVPQASTKPIGQKTTTGSL